MFEDMITRFGTTIHEGDSSDAVEGGRRYP